MSILKKLSLGLIGVSITLFSTNAFAYGDTWVEATLAESFGRYPDNVNPRLSKFVICDYKTDQWSGFPNYHFSIMIEGHTYSCPRNIKYNPVTKEWKE